MEFVIKKYLQLLLVGFFCFSLPVVWAEGDETPANSDRSPGSSEESFQTSLFTGSYNRQMPIAVPPGTGLQPTLSLSYSSGAVKARSILGAGWSLSGLGAIERSTKRGVPNFDETNGTPPTSSDRFLLKLGGTFDLVHVPADQNSPYHSGRENFLRIQFFSKTHPDPVKGGFSTVYWVVTDKTGTQFRYGYNADSNIVVLDPKGMSKQKTLSWQLDRVTDTHGNYIEIQYLSNTSAGGVYPSIITYTKNDTSVLSFYRRVYFNYESRPDRIKDFSSGSFVKLDLRLKTIQTTVNTTQVNKYVMNYSESPLSGKSLLESIQIFGSDGTTALPPTAFTYQNSQVGWTNNSAWGASIPDVLSKDTKFNGVQVIDVNGDSLPDFVKSTPSTKQVWLNNGSGWNASATPSWSASIPASFFTTDSSGDPKDSGLRLFDVNADGLPDFARAGSGGDVWLNTGNSWAATPDPSWSVSIKGVTKFSAAGMRIMDLNGDGFPDIAENSNARSITVSKCELVGTTSFNPSCSLQSTSIPNGLSSVNREVWRNTRSGWVSDSLLRGALIGSAFQTTIQEIRYSGCSPVIGTTVNVDLGIVSGCTPTSEITKIITPSDSFTRYAEANGDGLIDIITSRKLLAGGIESEVYLNTGAGWIKDLAYSASVPKALATTDFTSTWSKIAAVSGNNTADFVSFESGDTGVFLNRASGWQQTKDTAWSSAIALLPRGQLTNDRQKMASDFIDLNGDGLLDYIYATQTGSSVIKRVYLAKGPVPDLLQQVKTNGGGTMTVQYKAAAQYRESDNTLSNKRIPYAMQTVESITRSSGMATSPDIVSLYHYTGGFFEGASKEFRGFQSVTVTDPVGTSTQTTFLQDNVFKGNVATVEVRDGNGLLYNKILNTWQQSSLFPSVSFISLKQTDKQFYDGASTAKETRVSYEYDRYGNATRVFNSGDISVVGDEHTSGVDFLHLDTASAYRISLPQRKFILDETEAIRSLSWYAYDNQANGVLPTLGDLTEIKNWNPDGADLVATFLYDSYGNPVGGTDANGNRSQMTLDPLFHSFPIVSTNAQNQSGSKQYYGIDQPLGPNGSIPGLLASVTDLNGVTSTFTYDVFGRKTADIVPPDTLASPTVTYAYDLDGTAPESTSVTVKDLSPEGGGSNTTRTIVDGLGRVIQTKGEAANPSQEVVVDRSYDLRGKPASVSNPYFATKVAGYTTPISQNEMVFQYDAIGRITDVTNADGSRVSTDPFQWTKTLIDANGRKRVEQRDADGDMIEVQEYKGQDGRNPAYPAAPYTLYATTQYEYDLFGNPVKIIDDAGNVTELFYDALGRKKAMNDPDMGSWSYHYDANGNLKHQVDAKGQSVYFAYDAVNRMTSKGPQNDTIPPSTPTNLLASAAGSGKVALSWTASSDNAAVLRYEVFRDGAFIKNALTASFTDTGLAPLLSYSYTVRAVDRMGNTSANAPAVTITTTSDTQSPSVPLNVVATALGENQINLRWSASTDNVAVSGYRVERSNNGVTFSEIAVLGTISYADQSLAPGSTRYYRIKAFDAGGNQSGVSAIVVSSTSDESNPTIPTGLAATALNETQAQLSWNAASDNVGVSTYLIERSSDSELSWPTTYNTASTSYTASGLVYGTTYYFRVSAIDASGNTSAPGASVWTKSIDITPPAPAPTIISATPIVGGAQVDITISGSTDTFNGVNYWFRRCTGSGCNMTGIGALTSPNTTFRYPTAPSTAYGFVVSAVDFLQNETPQSAIAYLTTPPDTLPPSTVNFNGANFSSNIQPHVSLNWGAATDNYKIEYYQLEVKRPGQDWTNLPNSTGTSYSHNVPQVSVTTIYQYQIRAYDGVNFSPVWSNVVQADIYAGCSPFC